MILPQMVGGPEVRARFRAEAEAVARLQHPHIVQIYEVGECQGRPYFSLEFLAGGSLADKLGGLPQPPPEAVRLLTALARAVHYAHQNHVVHRDLKPANILLTADDTPKVADFCLAKLLDAEGRSQTGELVGTPAYMAPEQAWGTSKVHVIGPAVDIFALGVLLYEMLTGRRPFQGEDWLGTLNQVCNQEPVPPSRLQHGVKRDLETICLKCLEKQPGRRYASAGELADDLEAFAQGRPIRARPVKALGRFWRWSGRNPLAAGMLAILVLVFLAGFAGVTWKWREAEDEKDQKEAARLRAKGETARAQAAEAKARRRERAERRLKVRARRAEADAKRRAVTEKRLRVQTHRALGRAEQAAYDRSVARADREWYAANVARVRELLGQCPRRLRRWEWHYIRRRCRLDLRTLSGHAKGVNQVAVSPDGKWIASAGIDGTVKVWRVSSSKEVRTFRGHKADVTCVAFPPNRSNRVASAGRDGTVRIWDRRTGKEVLAPLRMDLALGLAFNADGSLLLAGGVRRDGKEWAELTIWDTATSKVKRSLRAHGRTVAAVAWSGDRKWIASVGMDGSLRVWDTKTWKPVHSFRTLLRGTYDRAVAFRPDGKWLAWGGPGGAVHLWEVGKPEQTEVEIGSHDGTVFGLAFSRDGRWLAANRQRIV
jgi:hypothetical protein